MTFRYFPVAGEDMEFAWTLQKAPNNGMTNVECINALQGTQSGNDILDVQICSHSEPLGMAACSVRYRNFTVLMSNIMHAN